MNAQASTFVVQPVQAPHATDAADGNLVVVALTAFVDTPGVVPFHAAGCAGTVEFAGKDGLVIADVYTADPDFLACGHLRHTRIAADAATAESIGFAFIAWAARSREERKGCSGG